jgi:hypothetical protein
LAAEPLPFDAPPWLEPFDDPFDVDDPFDDPTLDAAGYFPRLATCSPVILAFPCPSASPLAFMAAGFRSVSVSSPAAASPAS